MTIRIIIGDCRAVIRSLPSESVNCCVTSPPYFGLRDYGVLGQIGLEQTPAEFVAAMVDVFREVRRVLRDDGTAWVVLGDSYSSGGRGARDVASTNKGNVGALQAHRPDDGLKPKDLIGIPWMVAFALRDDGWYLRKDIIWAKTAPMPESVKDRPTSAHEHVFLLAKSQRYYYDADAVREAPTSNPGDGRRGDGASYAFKPTGAATHMGVPEAGRNMRDVWLLNPEPFADAHFATFPTEIPRRCILAGCPKDGMVLDPFGGAGTTGLVAQQLDRSATLIELNPEYAAMAERRIYNDAPLLAKIEMVAA